ncbi:hypothetical protein GCM10010449_01550 [Streptomyces rectiviolaceus]|uniref:Uncharacterized protein n=1 Tax=Streptomyces rectiviolaceus TaxID=332591 RepID=A0ABP6M5M7_9ACTN
MQSALVARGGGRGGRGEQRGRECGGREDGRGRGTYAQGVLRVCSEYGVLVEGTLSIRGVMRVIDAVRPIPFVEMWADRE